MFFTERFLNLTKMIHLATTLYSKLLTLVYFTMNYSVVLISLSSWSDSILPQLSIVNDGSSLNDTFPPKSLCSSQFHIIYSYMVCVIIDIKLISL